jgi:5'-nucleotidase
LKENYLFVKILVTNDDGINSPGLWRVVEELRRVGEVVVVAPRDEQSGVGTSANLHRAIKVLPQAVGKGIYATDGTPVDCVLLAFRVLFPGEIALVVSGINKGPNTGYDVFISGTVAGALIGYFHGAPSFAVSVDAYEGVNFEAAARLTAIFADRVKKGDLPRATFLNINLPNLSPGEIEGIEVTRLSKQSHSGVIKKVPVSEGEGYTILRDKVVGEAGPGSDARALEQKRISVTPLLQRFWGSKVNDSLPDLASAVFAELVNR